MRQESIGSIWVKIEKGNGSRVRHLGVVVSLYNEQSMVYHGWILFRPQRQQPLFLGEPSKSFDVISVSFVHERTSMSVLLSTFVRFQ